MVVTQSQTNLHTVTISNDQICATILNFGARLIDLRLAGHANSLVLNLAKLSDHLNDMSHMGAIAGPVANRIAGATASLNDKSYHFEPNENTQQTLHGGDYGTGRQFWQLTKISETMLHASLTQDDGALGFPGKRNLSAIYRLEGNKLHLFLSCTTDAPSWCNLAPHAYFNLDGSTDIRHHYLQITAHNYLPVNKNNIPTGIIAPVAGTNFDFQNQRSLTDFVTGKSTAIDHNYCLKLPTQPDPKIQTVATLVSEASSIKMELSTDQPGLQLYFSQFLEDGTAGSDGRTYGPFSGICLEPQGWPDAPNQTSFPPVEILPQTPYLSHSCFAFTKT